MTRLIYYSIACMPGSRCEDQWVQSVRSLRRYNTRVPVLLFVYGDPRPATLDEARRRGVEVRVLGDYTRCFRDQPRGRHETFARYPTLHKVLSLDHCPVIGVDQMLYLDCDTFFFDDSARLFERYAALHWYAREEPCTTRGALGFDPTYLDAGLLRDIFSETRATLVTPCNTGAFLMNHGTWFPLRERAALFLDFVWRLFVGMLRWPLKYDGYDDRLMSYVHANATEADWRRALPYPSRNAWIVEQVALWLTLGSIPHLRAACFTPGDVAQGAECERTDGCVLAHYFSIGERAFFSHVERH